MSDQQMTTATVLHCTQCGGELQQDQGQIFVTCPYCTSTVYLDKSRVVFHWYLNPTLNEAKARGALARWMAGNSTVKDLDKKSKLVAKDFQFFPLWYFKRKDGKGKETLFSEPAAATSISEIKRVRIPAGDLRNYIHDLDTDAVPPTVPLEAAHKWLQSRGVNTKEITENAIVHLPIYVFKYNYEGDAYTAVVEGATGRVFANIFPAKAEAPFQIVAGLAALTFLVLAVLPVLFGLFNGGEGLTLGMVICIAGGLPAAAVFFALAAWVSAKV
jgi:DNA-directed RNA polymerase subunit RPC12/RpoP